MRTGHHHCPETLLAGMDASFAELVVLAPAVLAQEERPFQTPFLATAHKSLSSGGGSAAGWTCPGLSVPRTPALRPPAAPGWRAFLRLPLPRALVLPLVAGESEIASARKTVLFLPHGVVAEGNGITGIQQLRGQKDIQMLRQPTSSTLRMLGSRTKYSVLAGNSRNCSRVVRR